MSDNHKKDKPKKPKRKINRSEYNESLIRRGEMLFDSDSLRDWRAVLKKMNKGKKKKDITIDIRTPCISLLATVHGHIPTSIPSIRRLSKDDVIAYKVIQESGTRFRDNLVGR